MRDDPELDLDVRLSRLAFTLVRGELAAVDAVRVAVAVVALGVDSASALELAGLPVEAKRLSLVDVEEATRSMLGEVGVALPEPGTAAWGVAELVAFQVVSGALDPVAGAPLLWRLGDQCHGDASTLLEMSQLEDAWEASVGEHRAAVEREMRVLAETILAEARAHTVDYRFTP